MHLQHTIKAVVRPGEQSGFVAECLEIPVVTQGRTLDETVATSARPPNSIWRARTSPNSAWSRPRRSW